MASRVLLVLTALLLSGGELLAASRAENQAFNTATNQFPLGFWDNSEAAFADFIQKFPESTRRPEAILYQAQARFYRRQFAGVVELLSTNEASAGRLADQYLYWTAKALFADGRYSEAAAAFRQLSERSSDSVLRLDAVVSRAAAFRQLADWHQVIELLEQPGGIFQQARQSGIRTELIPLGLLLLGEAHLSQGNSGQVKAVLDSLAEQSLGAELNWRRQYLQCRWHRAEGRLLEALQSATNLVASVNPTNRAEGIAFEADVLERLNQSDDAIATYEKNLGESVPIVQQRQALFKIGELSLESNRTTNAIQMLEKYVARANESSPAAEDLALLTLGELQLKQHLTSTGSRNGAATNHLKQALDYFNLMLARFPNSPLAGKALLGKGWCLWTDDKFAESGEAFRQATAATSRSPILEDQAVARFKWADTQFKLRDFDGAITNYTYLVTTYGLRPEVRDDLIERALYLTVRAALEVNDAMSATNALRQLLDGYRTGFAGPALLLTGEDLTRRQDPVGARALFDDFEKRYPDSPLLPDLWLAKARTYEQQRKWEDAIAIYDAWVATFSTNTGLPAAEFWRAVANDKANRQTNALHLFEAFLTNYPSSDLAPRAQWWIGCYYFNQANYRAAELNYQFVFQKWKWPSNDLFYEAQMAAGRAAVAGKIQPKEQLDYFAKLFSDSGCPMNLKLQAAFASADVLFSRSEPDPEKRKADLNEAIDWLQSISRLDPTNALVPAAWGRIGDGYKELGDFKNAVDAYQRATNGTAAVCTWAKIGLGLVAERRAAEATNATEQVALRNQALKHYLAAYGDRTLEKPDLNSSSKGGLEAARLGETMGKYEQAIGIYQQIKDLLPSLATAMDKKILRARERAQEKK